jgi:hypothetical protein
LGLLTTRRHHGDGVEDLAICFVDRAKHGSYFAQQALLVTRYTDTDLLIALKYELDDCESVVR